MDRDSNYIHYAILILLLLISVNLFIVDLKIFAPVSVNIAQIKTTPVPENDQTALSADKLYPELARTDCPASCLSAINFATESMNTRTGTAQTAVSSAGQTAVKQLKEFYIPLGSGSTAKNDWDNMVSTETLIDTSIYGQIDSAYFIAGLKNPTGNGQIEAQLYNVTDKNPVWGSHVIMNGPTEQTITSGKIGLAQGPKVYRVQLKSSLSYQASLENARIRILAY
ncbi:MAG: hypothetical protein UV73_C0014G0012 [Candidatus Gottesmanbacteria bacterium GW2011_GWA2_43_14]|uniref:Uncharacterized protein n=1 Tax=Candidatus Gottesmanbacteria bacterium GW2011_GWA2_43_14 TaxID=1618443 RepID=A0A0G1DD15_9BACT|nr:MAG: hypothetical protein UV73_C0014G0012 [Candidatus Gottesmanbacteria bacterium GW2011_GWA2_43_14]